MEDSQIVTVAHASSIERHIEVVVKSTLFSHIVIVTLPQVRPELSILISMYGEIQYSGIGLQYIRLLYTLNTLGDISINQQTKHPY